MTAQAARAALSLSGCVSGRDEAALADDLVKLHDLLRKWQKVQNLVAGGTLADVWTRHMADSLQLTRYLPEQGGYEICDLGSGGGFPGLPLAIALKDRDVHVTLVEANSRKVAFLRAAAREIGLKVTVADARIADFVSRETPRFAVFTARALAPLSKLCGYVHPLWRQDCRALFLKGREHVEEITESGARWRHDVVIHGNRTDRRGVILEITDLRPLTD